MKNYSTGGLLAIILLCMMLLTLFPPTAQALDCPAQDGTVWYLDYAAGDDPLRSENCADGTENSATLDSITTDWWWWSDEFAETQQWADGTGWTFNVEFYFGYVSSTTGNLGIEIYEVPSSGAESGTLMASGSQLVQGQFSNQEVSIGLTGETSQYVHAGNHLALRMTWDQATTISVKYDHTGSCSNIASDSAPAPPIPELTVIILMAIGLLGIGSFVWYKRRRSLNLA
ncbi:MAG: hypothetical protein R6U37_06595 [Dehalococcoidia bacterium]